MKFKYLSIFLLGASLTGLTACNDYLDVEPQSDIPPAAFFTTADDLAAYTINLYNSTFDYISPGSYGISVFGWDNDTDNQAGVIIQPNDIAVYVKGEQNLYLRAFNSGCTINVTEGN